MKKNKFNLQEIYSILHLASKLNKICSVTINNIFGETTYKINMNDWNFSEEYNKFFYNKRYAVNIDDIISINICI